MNLLLHVKESRATLLALLEVADFRDERLRHVVAALAARPDADAETLMTDLPDDTTRGLLAALLVEDRVLDDPARLIEQFKTHLEREQRLKRQRALTRVIAESQATTGSGAAVHDEFRALYDESKIVYGMTRAVAQSLEHGSKGPQGVETND